MLNSVTSAHQELMYIFIKYWVGQKVRSVFECYLSGLLKIVLQSNTSYLVFGATKMFTLAHK